MLIFIFYITDEEIEAKEIKQLAQVTWLVSNYVGILMYAVWFQNP